MVAHMLDHCTCSEEDATDADAEEDKDTKKDQKKSSSAGREDGSGNGTTATNTIATDVRSFEHKLLFQTMRQCQNTNMMVDCDCKCGLWDVLCVHFSFITIMSTTVKRWLCGSLSPRHPKGSFAM